MVYDTMAMMVFVLVLEVVVLRRSGKDDAGGDEIQTRFKVVFIDEKKKVRGLWSRRDTKNSTKAGRFSKKKS